MRQLLEKHLSGILAVQTVTTLASRPRHGYGIGESLAVIETRGGRGLGTRTNGSNAILQMLGSAVTSLTLDRWPRCGRASENGCAGCSACVSCASGRGLPYYPEPDKCQRGGWAAIPFSNCAEDEALSFQAVKRRDAKSVKT